MGLRPLWTKDFQLAVEQRFPDVSILQNSSFCLVGFEDRLVVNLVNMENSLHPQALIALQNQFSDQKTMLIHLWEDIWISRRSQVLSRINSFLGLNISVHARKTKINTVSKEQSVEFLSRYHLQGYVRARYNFGLFLDNELVAMASFSDKRSMRSKGTNYQSAEMVRFASKAGITVVGGLSKLMSYFLEKVQVDDLMTYADRDWSLGKGYDRLGFKLSEITQPATIFVHKETLARYFIHRLPKETLVAFNEQNLLSLNDFLVENGYIKLFNTGNLKYHLYI